MYRDLELLRVSELPFHRRRTEYFHAISATREFYSDVAYVLCTGQL
jgi:hypothetical protein